MKKLILLALLLVILSVPAVLYTQQKAKPAPSSDTVEILQDNKVIETIDLAKETGERTITIPYGEHYNTLLIKDHTIRVLEADCPDQICVQMGILQKGQPPIVCLPHHLVVRYAGDNGRVDGNA